MALIGAFRAQGAYYITDGEERNRLREALFPGGVMNRNLVGRPIAQVAAAAGLDVPEGTKVILTTTDGPGRADLFSKEKMCAVISCYTYKTFEEAVDIAAANLDVEGRGHSVAIHSDNREHLEYAAQRLPVSRVLVNQICATMNGGSFYNGLAPTTTLGCGSWGNNSISENLTYRHLMNVTRIAEYRSLNQAPTDEEIWA
jgi:succinate-semialdehyde dehydrogenase